MKNLVFAFALLCSTSLVAQFSYNSTDGTGIESIQIQQVGIIEETTTMGFKQQQVGVFQLLWVLKQHAIDYENCYG